MERTQIYLTTHQRDELNAIAKSSGKKLSELIREAVDSLIDRMGRDHKKEVLRKTAGMWKDRKDLPDFEAIRTEWDREKE